MSAPHLFAPSVEGERVVIEGDDAHHAVRVLRLRVGERVTVSDGAGAVADGVVIEAGKALVIESSGHRRVAREAPRVSVYQGIPKSGKLEHVVQKLTEIGVDEIIPLKTKRSIPRWESGTKTDRLRIVAREAAKQSHRAWLPNVEDAVDIANVANIANIANTTSILLHEEAEDRLLVSLPPDAPARVVLFVGPEGGFASDEVDALAGIAVPVSLGPQILRTETAALVATALIMGHYRKIG